MPRNFINNRYQAFLAHFACSFLIAAGALLTALYFWYPGELRDATGATKIFALVLMVDVCLGPFLTLVVFDKRKKELSRDLSIIFLVQIAGLCYGLYTLTIARPVYIVYAVDRFELVQANDIAEDNLANAAKNIYRTLPLRPIWIAAHLPEDSDERNSLIFNNVAGGADLAQLPRYYHPYSSAKPQIIKRAKSINELKKYNTLDSVKINDLIAHYESTQKHLGYLPLAAKFNDKTVIVNKSSGEVLGIVDLQPW